MLVPMNYCQVDIGLYRSGCPSPENLAFLRTLKLRTVISLLSHDEGKGPQISEKVLEFYKQEGIKLIEYDFGKGNRHHLHFIDKETCRMALMDLLNPELYPIMVHCKKGKHRTGSLIGLYRKLHNWSCSNIFHEYCLFEPKDKSRVEDERFIEQYDVSGIKCVASESTSLDTI